MFVKLLSMRRCYEIKFDVMVVLVHMFHSLSHLNVSIMPNNTSTTSTFTMTLVEGKTTGEYFGNVGKIQQPHCKIVECNSCLFNLNQEDDL